MKAENSKEINKRKRVERLRAYQFKPGQSGNPGGRPKKTLLTDVCEELLAERLEDPKSRAEFKAAIWAKLLSGRVVGSMTLDTVWERTEGKVAQDVTVKGALTVNLADELRKAAERVTRMTADDSNDTRAGQ